jgi:hypothetical protein
MWCENFSLDPKCVKCKDYGCTSSKGNKNTPDEGMSTEDAIKFLENLRDEKKYKEKYETLLDKYSALAASSCGQDIIILSQKEEIEKLKKENEETVEKSADRYREIYWNSREQVSAMLKDEPANTICEKCGRQMCFIKRPTVRFCPICEEEERAALEVLMTFAKEYIKDIEKPEKKTKSVLSEELFQLEQSLFAYIDRKIEHLRNELIPPVR